MIVTEELFSSREIFENETKMPKESRQKPVNFNRTEKMKNFQSTGRTLFYLNSWGQLTANSSVLDIIKMYRLYVSKPVHINFTIA